LGIADDNRGRASPLGVLSTLTPIWTGPPSRASNDVAEKYLRPKNPVAPDGPCRGRGVRRQARLRTCGAWAEFPPTLEVNMRTRKLTTLALAGPGRSDFTAGAGLSDLPRISSARAFKSTRLRDCEPTTATCSSPVRARAGTSIAPSPPPPVF